jgi:hypothetical protein
VAAFPDVAGDVQLVLANGNAAGLAVRTMRRR